MILLSKKVIRVLLDWTRRSAVQWSELTSICRYDKNRLVAEIPLQLL